MRGYRTKNVYYDKIVKKVEDGIFVKGKDYSKYLGDNEISQIPVEKRTRKFYLNTFANNMIGFFRAM